MVNQLLGKVKRGQKTKAEVVKYLNKEIKETTEAIHLAHGDLKADLVKHNNLLKYFLKEFKARSYNL